MKAKQSKVEIASEFLLDYLAHGPQPATKILADAKTLKISRTTLFEAKNLIEELADEGDLIVRAERRWNGWFWCLTKVNSRARPIEYYERVDKQAKVISYSCPQNGRGNT